MVRPLGFAHSGRPAGTGRLSPKRMCRRRERLRCGSRWRRGLHTEEEVPTARTDGAPGLSRTDLWSVWSFRWCLSAFFHISCQRSLQMALRNASMGLTWVRCQCIPVPAASELRRRFCWHSPSCQTQSASRRVGTEGTAPTSLVCASSPGALEPLFVEQDSFRDDQPCAIGGGDFDV